MPEYKITRISNKPPRDWSFKDKKTGADVAMQTHKVIVEGEDDPIDLNRKPGNPPTVGEVLSGTIEETDFGKKFKPERKPYTPGAGFVKDTSEIRAQMAIKAAVQFYQGREDVTVLMVEEMANELYAMVDRIKAAPSPAKPKLSDDTFADGTPVPTTDDGMVDVSDDDFPPLD